MAPGQRARQRKLRLRSAPLIGSSRQQPSGRTHKSYRLILGMSMGSIMVVGATLLARQRGRYRCLLARTGHAPHAQAAPNPARANEACSRVHGFRCGPSARLTMAEADPWIMAGARNLPKRFDAGANLFQRVGRCARRSPHLRAVP